jgi:hypothetical protein
MINNRFVYDVEVSGAAAKLICNPDDEICADIVGRIVKWERWQCVLLEHEMKDGIFKLFV